MAITNGYVTLAQFKDWMDIGDTDDADDSKLERAVEAASRMIDRETGRFFYDNAGTRYYDAKWYDRLWVDDIAVASSAAAITSIKTDDDEDGTYETTWTTSDYYVSPANHVELDRPVESIIVNRNGSYVWPVNVQRGVEIVATFGWTIDGAAPTDIAQACLIAAAAIYKRKDAIFGVSGNTALGVQLIQTRLKKDADFMGLIDPYRRKVLNYL